MLFDGLCCIASSSSIPAPLNSTWKVEFNGNVLLMASSITTVALRASPFVLPGTKLKVEFKLDSASSGFTTVGTGRYGEGAGIRALRGLVNVLVSIILV